MNCKHCNNAVPNDSEYCPFCGNTVERTIIENNIISQVEKGYTYLELREWGKAKEIFDFAIVNNDNKAKAYIGRLLSQLKLTGLESLTSVNKKLTSFEDFKLAVKYADGSYKALLEKCHSFVEHKISEKKAKSKKRVIILSVSCVTAVAILALSYFVFIPLGRYTWYKNLLSKGETVKATAAYSESKWFEFDEKTEQLFYNSGVSLVENKDYEKALRCFEITKDFKETKNYYNYCKAQVLLAKNNLESYKYFTDCKDFLDSKNILETNKYFVLVNKLQGKWLEDEIIVKDTIPNKKRGNIIGYATRPDFEMEISGLKVNYNIYYSKHIENLTLKDGEFYISTHLLEIIDEKTILYQDVKYCKL